MAEVNTYFPTGNDMRDHLILQAIAAAGAGATLTEVDRQIPDFARKTFGSLLAEEHSEALQWLAAQGQHDGDVQVEHDGVSSPARQENEQVEPTIPREEILDHIRALNQAIGRERGELLRLQNLHADSRRKLSEKILAYQTKRKPMTREQLVRQEIAASQKLKQDVKDGKVAPRQRRVGPSRIDQMAAATAGGNFRAGGGLSFRRGASTQRGLRVPSERS